jgi:hypothetical protein
VGSGDQRARGFPPRFSEERTLRGRDAQACGCVFRGQSPGPAAAEFERIAADAHEDPKVQREALLESADLYAKANNSPKAVAMLEKFVASHPPLGDAVEARQRLADYAGHAGDATRQAYWEREIVQADAQAGAARTDRTRYLAGKAQIQLAVPARDAFRNVKLVLPLKKSLIAKRKALDDGAADYKRGSTTRWPK